MILVLEGVTRVEERISYGVPFFSRVARIDDLVWLHPEGPRGRPGARFNRFALNQMGLRGPEISPSPDTGTARVVVVGASETFGLYESPQREFPRQLEDSLNVRRAGACVERPSGIEVANAALPGMAIPTMELRIADVGRLLRPDVLVLYPTPGFYLNPRPPKATRGYVGGDTALPSRNALRLRVKERAEREVKTLIPSAVKGWLRQVVTNRRSTNSTGPHFDQVPADRFAKFDQDLRRLVGVAKSTAANVILMGHANVTLDPAFSDSVLIGAWVFQLPNATGETILEFHRRALKLEREVARDSGVVFVDLPAAFHGRWKGSFADFIHFTDAGAGIVAATLADTVRTFLPCAR
jgi:hypothetical protein